VVVVVVAMAIVFGPSEFMETNSCHELDMASGYGQTECPS
jgi:hypothetical protein